MCLRTALKRFVRDLPPPLPSSLMPHDHVPPACLPPTLPPLAPIPCYHCCQCPAAAAALRCLCDSSFCASSPPPPHHPNPLHHPSIFSPKPNHSLSYRPPSSTRRPPNSVQRPTGSPSISSSPSLPLFNLPLPHRCPPFPHRRKSMPLLPTLDIMEH